MKFAMMIRGGKSKQTHSRYQNHKQNRILFGKDYKRVLSTAITLTVLFIVGMWLNYLTNTIKTTKLHANSKAYRIAFGSCHNTTERLDIWQPINQLRPNIWIWGGDIIYADSPNTNIHQSKYNELLSLPPYQLLMSYAKVIGVWDDHDYGGDNVGIEYPAKRASQKMLLDFLKEPATSPRRKQQGIYTSYDYIINDFRIKIILLDVRYFRAPPHTDSDILGSEQWHWLRKTIKSKNTSQANMVIVVSGSQVIPSEHEFEKWSDYPQSRSKLLNMLHKLSTKYKIILSGDRHHAEISKSTLARSNSTIYELTSSGLTHAHLYRTKEKNSSRISDLFTERNFGLIEVAIDKQESKSITLNIFDIHGRNVIKIYI
jgi:alkaline phosphatase D